MREYTRMSDDPQTPNQRIRVREELGEWGMVTIFDEDTTSRSDSAQPIRSVQITLMRDEAFWLRKVLNVLDLGDGARRPSRSEHDSTQVGAPHRASCGYQKPGDPCDCGPF